MSVFYVIEYGKPGDYIALPLLEVHNEEEKIEEVGNFFVERREGSGCKKA